MSKAAAAGHARDTALDDHWFAFMHRFVGQLQSTYRQQNERLGLTKKDIAARIGKDAGFVSRCLAGQQNMTVRTMHNLARGMGCRLDLMMQPLDQIPPRNNRPPADEIRPITSKNDPGIFDVQLGP